MSMWIRLSLGTGLVLGMIFPSPAVPLAHFRGTVIDTTRANDDDAGDVVTQRRDGTVVIRNGPDGRVLWERRPRSGFYARFIDIRSDARREAVVSRLFEDETSCGKGGSSRIDQRRMDIRVWAPADGRTVWTRIVSRTRKIDCADLTSDGTMLPEELKEVPDLDGDGSRDLFITTRGSRTAPDGSEIRRVGGIFLAGRDGGTIGSVATGCRVPICSPQMWPVRDLSGDGRADLVSIESHEGKAKLIARTAGGHTLWRRTVPANFGNSPELLLNLRLTTDERADLIFSGYDAERGEAVGLAIGGANGHTLWTRDFVDALAVGDVDRDGRTDLAITAHPGADYESHPFVGVIDGASGEEIWSRSDVPSDVRPEEFWSEELVQPRDFGSDRVDDLVLRGAAYNREACEGGSDSCELPRWSRVRALDGRTGKVLWRDDEFDPEVYFEFTFAGDTTGDGIQDLVRIDAAIEQGSCTVRVEVHNGRTFERVWRRVFTRSSENRCTAVGLGSATLDGRGAHELLMELSWDGRHRTLVAFGPDGVLWTV